MVFFEATLMLGLVFGWCFAGLDIFGSGFLFVAKLNKMHFEHEKFCVKKK